MVPSTRPALTQPRSEVERRIRERIDKAKDINPGRIKSAAELQAAEEREKKWRAFNLDMLRSMFTTDEYADEYASSQKHVHFHADRYNDPSIRDYELRMIENLRSQVASLDSIVERLQFVDESTMEQAKGETGAVPRDRTKVFVVHGHDEGAREAVARFLGQLGIKPIILHEQANEGRTVIEKVEAHGDVGFAVVLLTPDDVGCVKGGTPVPRARQNVLLELGYFVGRLDRKNVCALKRGDLEIPSDFGGVVYEPFDDMGGWRQKLGRELQAAGFEFDWNKVMRP